MRWTPIGIGNTVPRRRESGRRFALCATLSVLAHAAIIASLNPEPASVSSRTSRAAPAVEVILEPSRPLAAPVPEQQTANARDPHAEPPAAGPAVQEPAAQAEPEVVAPAPNEPARLDLRFSVIEPPLEPAVSAGPDGLDFRPDLQQRVATRLQEKRREALVAESRVQRLGLDTDLIEDGTEGLTRIGDRCYATAAPVTSLERGRQISEVDCPGKRPWWDRDLLDEVAVLRGLP